MYLLFISSPPSLVHTPPGGSQPVSDFIATDKFNRSVFNLTTEEWGWCTHADKYPDIISWTKCVRGPGFRFRVQVKNWSKSKPSPRSYHVARVECVQIDIACRVVAHACELLNMSCMDRVSFGALDLYRVFVCLPGKKEYRHTGTEIWVIV